ncbi:MULTISPECIES: FxsB family cyclophane-forming radical SAM/SPASM peptide maturase [Streptomyces]|uniref:FxsB family cyclophane-forming radical SAM/SPASM peptide maturase n=1 Tax=Streptomyces TaxID=1883 RepID=UPI000A3BE8FB|nr:MULTISPECIES: FxsB family cyclophane-forming radical SAM/SPASM peptide maturase [Streptomyces]MDX3617828.1 FxsB family radical SAM/SPASM domain protein [Streptomyces europaeiscabiei]MDX3636692.1 FxsB family radical SAM/SPASM domain protein [Streptomyces europaeiscabiei]MDX3654777.1 FxsB family radical SAM/SPASM domain protein [Streptomyces europaeiscabiei]WUD33933.1 FxsB family radical SAM/SPASM domain protein [Streptomyces europaeiscabiei]
MNVMGRPLLPLRQFVLKMHSRCDLACDHCYVYEHADQSWRGRPRVVSDEVLRTTAERIAEHAKSHELTAVHVVLHGGEPLLAGRTRLRRAAAELTAALGGVCELDLRIHTNAVTLDERFLDLFDEFGIKVGVSLDGDRAANDLHRRYADGRSSHDRVLRAVALLNRPRYRHLFAGILCTIDLRNDPVAVHDALAELTPPRVDFLLPHATWDEPPVRPAEDIDATAYARWLLTVHDRWAATGRSMDVRVFDSVLRTLRGESSLTESLGLAPADLAVIETDGTFEQADSLKTAHDGAPATGLDVFAHSLDEVAAHPGIVARQQGVEGLAAQCRACPVVRSCGGGLYAHRYRSDGSGFLNPSVYCSDLLSFITDLRDRHMADQSVQPALAEHHLAELATGRGTDTTVNLLARHQLALVRELLGHVRHGATHTPPGGDAEEAEYRGDGRDGRDGRDGGDGEDGEDAWNTLTVLDSEAPESVDTVLAHPYVRSWALGCLGSGPQAGQAGGDAESAAATATRGIAEITAAAAVRAGRPAAVVVPVHEGLLRLPSLGTLTVGAGAERVVVRTDADGFTVHADDRMYTMPRNGPEDPAWRGSRRFELDGWTVTLEDTDPSRACHGHPAHPRLTEEEAEAWRADLAGAWAWIRRELPEYAPGIAAGLQVITPLLPSPEGADISSAARDAFGAVAIARPATPQTLALLLVHEFQHVKLGAVLDLVDLYDPACEKLFYAPWRPDPRPLEGLLQGTYAHLAVVDFWRARWRITAGAEAHAAEIQFSRWRDQTAEAVETLAASGALTPVGERFVAGVRETVRRSMTASVGPDALRTAREMAEEHRGTWRAASRPAT